MKFPLMQNILLGLGNLLEFFHYSVTSQLPATILAGGFNVRGHYFTLSLRILIPLQNSGIALFSEGMYPINTPNSIF